jgi:hypothetical protein
MTQDLCTGPLWDKGGGTASLGEGKKERGSRPLLAIFQLGKKIKLAFEHFCLLLDSMLKNRRLGPFYVLFAVFFC